MWKHLLQEANSSVPALSFRELGDLGYKFTIICKDMPRLWSMRRLAMRNNSSVCPEKRPLRLLVVPTVEGFVVGLNDAQIVRLAGQGFMTKFSGDWATVEYFTPRTSRFSNMRLTMTFYQGRDLLKSSESLVMGHDVAHKFADFEAKFRFLIMSVKDTRGGKATSLSQ